MKIHRQSFWLSGSVCLLLVITKPSWAQVVADPTLPSPSTVTSNGNISIITGGTEAGSNLFHSFREFSVPDSGIASFQQINQGIENVIARVTGSSASNINGLIQLLQTNGAVSSANLFLINPNGIIFGANAALNVGGSFVASTASSLNFADGTAFSAATGQTTALLTVSVPIGLQFASSAGRIINQSQARQGNATNSFGLAAGLQVPTGNTLALVGGDVALEGGNLTAAQGRIELGSVAGSGLVSLNSNQKGWALGYESIENFGEIHFSQRAIVDVSDEGGGDTQIQGGRVSLTDESFISADTLGSQNGGENLIRASQLSIESFSLVGASTFSSGEGGNVTIETAQLLASGGGQVSVGTEGEGSGGNLIINASESVELVGGTTVNNNFTPSGLFTQAAENATGTGGNLLISTGKLTVRDGAQVNSTTRGAGRAGDLTVRAADVELIGTLLSAAGELVTDDRGLPFTSGLFAGTDIASQGDGGTLSVISERLTLRDGAVAQTSALSQGNAGNLIVQASQAVELVGTAKDSLRPTSLLAVSGGIPGVGVIFEATGKGGDITIAARELIVRDGAAVAVSRLNPTSNAQGAGDIDITTQNMRLDNSASLTAATASGNGGSIKLQNQDLLLLRRNSAISTEAGIAGAGGNGGNINLNSGFVVAFPQENSDIIANAFNGSGGNIDLRAESIFGLQYRNELTPRLNATSDITASSRFGVSGTVTINTPDVDPSRGLVNLPTNIVDASGLIARSCRGGGERIASQQSEFVVTGRGGLPPSPSEALGTQAVWQDLRPPTRQVATVTQLDEQFASPIVEARGWVINPDGQVILTAQALLESIPSCVLNQ